jgi:hypothetical protein
MDARSPSSFRRRRAARVGAIVVGVAAIVFLIVGAGSNLPSGGRPAGSVPEGVRTATAPTAVPATPPTAASLVPSTTAPLVLSVADDPDAICALELTSCAAGVGISRVTLTATAPPAAYETWPAVQVAFVIETTVYDGVYDPSQSDWGGDACASDAKTAGPACEESNGVPFFVANAQIIADAIQAANPHSVVQFALADYFATLDQMDDSDGSEYHVDIPRFIPASQFGNAVQSTLGATVLESGYRYSDSDFSDNILHSSSITALYGAIVGSGLNWSAATHHVIVWIGDTAPRASGFAQDYCVSPSSHYPVGSHTPLPCYSSTCEPSYNYGTVVSPQCEGWVVSQDSNVTHSIAELAKTAPSCTDSIGDVCTVDTVDLWATPTDPQSPGWPVGDATATLQGGPGGVNVLQNVARVLLAGCELAAATGGSWSGPSFFTCPNGQPGSLQPSFLGPYSSPNLQNPSLLAALRGVSFGPVLNTVVATGTDRPLFTFVPYGAIQVLPGAAAQFRTECLLGSGQNSPDCPITPGVSTVPAGPGKTVEVYTWNWSSVAAANVMSAGDTWITSFWIMADGPPYELVPVDACTTPSCALGGSQAVGGEYTSATYYAFGAISALVQSFPLASITVQTPPSAPPPPSLPPPPPVPPPPAIPAPAGVPVLTTIGVAAQVGVASLSLQAAAAGFIAAGFTAISVRNRPMSIAVAQLAHKTTPVRSRFEEAEGKGAAAIGHFE